MFDVIIIGAGAAGLNAARKLSKQSKSVLIVEARDRIGGRIHTVKSAPFSTPIEYGAEFIHGDLPVTKALLKEAGVPCHKGSGKVWNVQEGKLTPGDFFTAGWDEMLHKLKQLDRDMSIADFLRKYFGGPEHNELRESIHHFVSGYDAADPEKASSLSLREEWLAEEDITGYHPEGGYSRLINFLHGECAKQHVTFELNREVTEITWGKGRVDIHVNDGKIFQASKAIITIPPAVLKTNRLKFSPEIPTYMEAIRKIETGGVIKFLVEFKEAYWENSSGDFQNMNDLHFLFSDAAIPTWWTQRPTTTTLLTGWLAGPVLLEIDRSENALRSKCFQSLAYLFKCSEEKLLEKIRAVKIIDWTADQFACGAYAYRSVDGNGALKVLSTPIEETIYFAGEAYHNGTDMGTVEAALKSAEDIVRKHF
jgi:monoamine oxidase